MADAGNIFRRSAEFHRHYRFCNQLGSHRADDVHAQDFVGFGIGQKLDHA